MSDIIHGETIEEKLASIEVALRQIARRSGSTVVGLISPVPIIHAQEAPGADGTIFSAIMPVPGVIETLAIGVQVPEKESVLVEITVVTGNRSLVLKVECKKSIETWPVNYVVAIGDLITIKVPATYVAGSIVALALHPELKNMKHHVFQALEELNNAGENHKG